MSKLLKNDVLCANDHFFNGNVARKIPVTYFWALYRPAVTRPLVRWPRTPRSRRAFQFLPAQPIQRVFSTQPVAISNVPRTS